MRDFDNKTRNLVETMVFTAEEMKKLRQKNTQPMDDDYFAQDLRGHSDEKDSVSPRVDEDHKIPNEDRIYPTSEKSNIEPRDENHIINEVSNQVENIDSETLEQVSDKSQLGENPFVYQSKEPELRAALEQERLVKEQIAQEKRERFKERFEDPYQPIYDEEELEVDAYNQFDNRLDTWDEDGETAWSDGQPNGQPSSRKARLQAKAEAKEKAKKPFLSGLLSSIQNGAKAQAGQLKQSLSNVLKPPVSVSLSSNDDDQTEDFQPTSVDENSLDKLKKESKINELVEGIVHGEDVDTYYEELDEIEALAEQALQETPMSEPVDLDHSLGETMGIQSIIEEIGEIENGEFDTLRVEEEISEINAGTSGSESDETDQSQEEKSFVAGTAWLTAGNIISRVLGALYVIPWAAWFGTSYLMANALYSVGYRSYALFLAISTAGFPSAIAKQLAYYHAQKEYRAADKLFKVSVGIMVIMGIISGGLFFLLAPLIAQNSATDMPEAAVVVIRSLAPALLILPVMSILRGYFQGFNDMVPTAVSQILEQVARIIYMLVATYAIMQVMTGDVTNAVAHSTFAAFIGALLSLIYLGVVYLRRRPAIRYLIDQSNDQVQLDIKQSLLILIKDSIPFILLGSGIIIAQNIDQFTFRQIIMSTSLMLESDISQLFGAMSLDVDKLIMIIVSIAVGMSLSSIPLITSLYAQKEIDKTATLIERIIVIFLVVMLPASLGMASIANNAYLLFYQNGHSQGPALLVTASILSIVLGAYTILSTLIQSMNFRRKAIRYLLIGLAVKVVLQFPMVALLHAHGALLSTLLAFLVTSVLTLLEIHRHVRLDFRAIVPDIIIITVSSILMALSASFWNRSFDILFGQVGRGLTFVKIILVVIIAAFMYIVMLGLFGRLHLLIGKRYRGIQEKMRMFG